MTHRPPSRHGPRTLLTVALVIGITTAALAAGPAQAGAELVPASWASLCPGRVAGPGTPYVAGANCRLVVSAGLIRRYVVYVPASVAASPDPAPVVFMFHGSSGTGEQFFRTSGWREVADWNRFIAVFPTGMEYLVLDSGRVNTKWHDFSLSCDVGPRPAKWPTGAAYPADDDRFVDAMILDAAVSEQIDAHRLYASGFSNGSAFAQSLSFTHPDTFAAIGSWAGTARECLDATGTPVRPIVPAHLRTPPATAPAIALGLGSRDDRYLEAINTYRAAGGLPPISEIPVTASSLDGPIGTGIFRPLVEHEGFAWGPSTPIGVDDWAGPAWLPFWPAPVYVTGRWDDPAPGNAAGSSVVVMLLQGVGHKWPNATLGKNVEPSGSVNAATLFWRFFERNVN